MLESYDKEVPILQVKADQLKVVDAETYSLADQFIGEIKGKIKKFKEWISPHKQAAHATWRGLCDEETRIVTGYEGAISLVAPSMIAWKQAQEVARKQKEAEEMARLKKLQEEEQLATAEILEKAGLHESADRVIEEPIRPISVRLPDPVPQAEATMEVTRWHAELISLDKLIQGVIDGKVPKQALEANMTFLNKQAVAMKDAFDYPGVVAVPVKKLASKGR